MECISGGSAVSGTPLKSLNHLKAQADLCQHRIGRQSPWERPWGAVCPLRVQRGIPRVEDSNAAAACAGIYQLAWANALVGCLGRVDAQVESVEQHQAAVMQ